MPGTKERLVASRLQVLHTVLSDSTFEPEQHNIKAAIAGYQSGAIAVSESYTLLWAGQVVDTCPTYTSFTEDREERLGRYLEQYGEGWLWWEPPLLSGPTGKGASPVLAKRGTCLVGVNAPDRLSPGHFTVCMGFRRMQPFVHRGDSDRDAMPQKGRSRRASSSLPSPTVTTNDIDATLPGPKPTRRNPRRVVAMAAAAASHHSTTTLVPATGRR